MKLVKYFVLLGALCLLGCGPTGGGGATGDQNDPEVTGTDDEMMNDESGDLGETGEEMDEGMAVE